MFYCIKKAIPSLVIPFYKKLHQSSVSCAQTRNNNTEIPALVFLPDSHDTPLSTCIIKILCEKLDPLHQGLLCSKYFCPNLRIQSI